MKKLTRKVKSSFKKKLNGELSGDPAIKKRGKSCKRKGNNIGKIKRKSLDKTVKKRLRPMTTGGNKTTESGIPEHLRTKL